MRKFLLLGISILLLAPLYFMFTGSFQEIYGLLRTPPLLIPRILTLANYRVLLGTPELARWVLNSMLTVGGGVFISLLVSFSAGYALTFNFRGKRVLTWMLLGALMIPRTAMLIPMFVEMRYLGLLNTIFAAFLPAMLYPFGVFLAKLYIETLPRAMAEEARMCGAGEWRILGEVIVPQCRPVIGILCLFQGVGLVNDYLWQMMTLRFPERMTLAVGLVSRAIEARHMNLPNPIGLRMAAGMVLFVPLVCIYCIASRYFTANPLRGVRQW